MNDTTRRFARTTAEAIPAERARWWFPPDGTKARRKPRRWVTPAVIALFAAALAAAFLSR